MIRSHACQIKTSTVMWGIQMNITVQIRQLYTYFLSLFINLNNVFVLVIKVYLLFMFNKLTFLIILCWTWPGSVRYIELSSWKYKVPKTKRNHNSTKHSILVSLCKKLLQQHPYRLQQNLKYSRSTIILYKV